MKKQNYIVQLFLWGLIAFLVSIIFYLGLLYYWNGLRDARIIPDVSGNIGSFLQGTMGVAVAFGGALVAIKIAHTANQTIQKQDIHERAQPYKEMVIETIKSSIGLRYEIGNFLFVLRTLSTYFSNIDQKIIYHHEKIKEETKNIKDYEAHIIIAKFIHESQTEDKDRLLKFIGIDVRTASPDKISDLKFLVSYIQNHTDINKRISLYETMKKDQIEHALKNNLFHHEEMRHIAIIFSRILSSLADKMEKCAQNTQFCEFISNIAKRKGLIDKFPFQIYGNSDEPDHNSQDMLLYHNMFDVLNLASLRFRLMSFLSDDAISEKFISIFWHYDKPYDLYFEDLEAINEDNNPKILEKRSQLEKMESLQCPRRIHAYGFLSFGNLLGSRHTISGGFEDQERITEGAFLFWNLAKSVTWNDDSVLIDAILTMENPDDEILEHIVKWIKARKDWSNSNYDKVSNETLDDIENLWSKKSWDFEKKSPRENRNRQRMLKVLKGTAVSLEI